MRVAGQGATAPTTETGEAWNRLAAIGVESPSVPASKLAHGKGVSAPTLRVSRSRRTRKPAFRGTRKSNGKGVDGSGSVLISSCPWGFSVLFSVGRSPFPCPLDAAAMRSIARAGGWRRPCLHEPVPSPARRPPMAARRDSGFRGRAPAPSPKTLPTTSLRSLRFLCRLCVVKTAQWSRASAIAADFAIQLRIQNEGPSVLAGWKCQ